MSFIPDEELTYYSSVIDTLNIISGDRLIRSGYLLKLQMSTY